MGWVAEKINDHQATKKLVGQLWNSLRDSVGEAVMDFCGMIHESGVTHKDCKARGSHCIRVEKPDGWIEIFLTPDDQAVRSALSSAEGDRLLCRYRLNGNRSALEFYRQEEKECVVMTADDVSRSALERFLFDPFPRAIISRTIV